MTIVAKLCPSLFLAAYLGLIIPVLGIGSSTLFVSAQTAILCFNVALIAILAVIATLALRQPVALDGRDHLLRIGSSTTEATPTRSGRRPVRIAVRHRWESHRGHGPGINPQEVVQ